MKTLIFFCLMSPLLSFGQHRKDYSEMVQKFVKYYNGNQSDSICTLFQARANNECFWLKTDNYSTYGEIINYKYLGIDPIEKVTIYKIQFKNKGTKAISFTLANGRFETFRFDTSSEYIQKLLAKNK